jgi:hypothetical protein
MQVRYKSTHSTQTDLSHFRRENVSQTFPAKTNVTQTTVSTGTNPPKNVLYVRVLLVLLPAGCASALALYRLSLLIDVALPCCRRVAAV